MADAKISALTAAALPLAGTEVLPIVQSASTKKVAVDDLTVKNVRSNATTGILQVAGPGASTTRVMTVPNANFTAARIDAAQTFSGTQTFAGANIYNVIDNTGPAGSNASPSFVGTQFLGNASRLIAQTDGGDCSSSSFRGVYRIQTSDDGSATMNTRMQFNGSTDITISTVNLIVGTAAKGVNFTANTPAAGMTSQLLNWYEEGTWTPVIGGSTGTSGQTYDLQSGFYTKVGRLVTVTFRVALTVKGTITGNAQIQGLPFAINAANGGQSSAAIGYFVLATNVVFVSGIGTLGGTTINLTKLAASGSNSANMVVADIDPTSAFMGCFSYVV